MAAAVALGDKMVIGSVNPVESKVVSVPTHEAINEKLHLSDSHEHDNKQSEKIGTVGSEINAVPATPPFESDDPGKDSDSDDNIIIDTAVLAAQHLLPMRDDHQPSLTFRSLFLASGLSCFQAVMTQIYYVSQQIEGFSSMIQSSPSTSLLALTNTLLSSNQRT